MKKSNRKKIIILLIIVLLLAINVPQKTMILGYAISTKHRTYVSNFKKYKNDYQVIADKIMSIKDETIESENKNNRFLVDVVKKKLYDSHDIKEIKLTKEEQNSFIGVIKSFDSNRLLAQIYFNDAGQICFRAESDVFAIVYSTTGKPTEMGWDEDANYNYYVKKLAKNWYSMTGNHKNQKIMDLLF